MSQQQQEQYLQNLRQQIQAQTIQEIMNKMGEKCFKVIYYSLSSPLYLPFLLHMMLVSCEF